MNEVANHFWERKICMSRKYLAAAGVIAVLVIALAFYLGSRLPGQSILPFGNTGGSPAGAGAPSSTTVADVPAGTVVPGKGDTNVSGDVAVPSIEVTAAPNTQSKLRIFSINISGNDFSPSTVAVNQGDSIQIKFTSMDKDYDVTQPDYGLKLSIPKGSTKTLAFDGVNVGKYTFYCESCGGPAKGPVGYAIVVGKQ